MKALIKIVFFCIGCLVIWVMAIASHSEWFGKYSNLFPNIYRYGDLYLQTNMPGFRIKDRKVKPVIHRNEQHTTLTIVGDSYTQHFDSSYFSSGIFHFIHYNSIPDTIAPLDTHQRNIIIIECTERHARMRFANSSFFVTGQKIPVKRAAEVELLTENHLQPLLTHYDWQLPFKELKTAIYLNVFDRFSEMVAKPGKEGRLYLKVTLEPNEMGSSFQPIDDMEIKRLVENMNKINDSLHRMGFDEVYFTIVPNPASIYKEQNDPPYNHLIERLQNDSSARFKTIDIYESFKKETTSVYKCNDTHWNELGKMIWLIKVNDMIYRSGKGKTSELHNQ